MHTGHRFPLVHVLLFLLVATHAFAAELGNLSTFSRQADVFDMQTEDGTLVRIEFLQADMFRIQVGPGGELTDEGSTSAAMVVPQQYPAINPAVTDAGDHRVITTSAVALRIFKTPLRLELYRNDNRTLLWKELKPLYLSEGRSYQSLSSRKDEHFFGGGQQNGSFEFKDRLLEISYSGGWEEGDRPSPAPFYMSSIGYGVFRNTWSDGSYDFRSRDFFITEHLENRFDAYYFVGPDIKRVLELYTGLSGRAPLLPRWAFEYGDADCYNDGDNVDKPGTVPQGWSDGPTGTTPDVVASVAARYREHDMPGGWILPNDGYGCGYTDLPEVVEALAEHGFHTGLWTEDGVEKIAWEVGEAGTRVQKLDVAWTGRGYQFALDANRDAAQGILDNSDSRPFLWTVMGWAGIQRYAVTWTGDQSGSWDYIRWHVSTLIGSGLSGQIYATGDVDGIFGGSPATFTRDLQWKCFTPVLMGMSGWSAAERKHPWWFDEPYRSINRTYLKLKMRLMPYMYTYARLAEQTGAPIVRGLMWDHVDDPHAYTEEVKNQFFLGRDLLIAPVFRSESASGGWRENVYLPAGQWIDYWDGTVTEVETGGRFIDYPVTLDRLPVLVRGGAIIPMYPEALYDGQVAKDVLTWDIYPGTSTASFDLYEDDGNTRAYRTGEFSRQKITVAGADFPARAIDITVDPVIGRYRDIPEIRSCELQVHTRLKPQMVRLDGTELNSYSRRSAFSAATSGWYFDPDDRYGVTFVKTEPVSIRQGLEFTIVGDSDAVPVRTPGYPEKPAGDGTISPDELIVINRPAEEPGHPLENAFDGDPDTWFRTVRDQSVKSGPHEFVLSLGGRREVDGFIIQPRNDKYWKYGNVRDYEIYMSDINGQWGTPITTGTLELMQESQTVHFDSHAGRLLRFRVLSTHDMGNDPMVLNAANNAAGTAYDAFAPIKVNPTTISEFRLLEHQVPDRPRQSTFLSTVDWALAENTLGPIEVDRANGGAGLHDGPPMFIDGLPFMEGLGVSGNSRVDYHLVGDWQLFTADMGIDRSSDPQDTVRFQVYGDEILLYDSGIITATAIVKPRLDIRGIKNLSLRTVVVEGIARANWCNARIIGYEGDVIGN